VGETWTRSGIPKRETIQRGVIPKETDTHKTYKILPSNRKKTINEKYKEGVKASTGGGKEDPVINRH